MKIPSTSTLTLPILVGFFINLPFMILEIVNRREFDEGFPFVLFGMMWAISTLFAFLLLSIAKDVKSGKNIFANPILFILRVVILMFIAWAWGGWVMDQMPCFLGVPNCD